MYRTGTVVAGKYRIEQVLGEGGMGVVVAATHIHLGTPVALKFLHQEMVGQASVVERFMREARASAQLHGENVCRVSDVGVSDDGCPFIVMELLKGQDLVAVMNQNGAMPIVTAVEIVMQACLALGEAHMLGIVHRDLKPANLFWTQRPDGTTCIKVLDFGVAKAPEDVNFSLTQTSSVIGSPGYMSPEQLKSSKGVDARSDIWSLGIVLYELVSGRKPFLGDSITELALRVSLDPAPPLMGAVPEPFEAVLRRCLEKEPAKRFQDVAELAAALAPFLAVRGSELAYAVARVLRGAHTPMPQAPAVAQTPTTLRGASGAISDSGVKTRRGWRLPAVMGLGAACGIALAIIMVGHRQQGPSAASAPSEVKKMDPVANETTKIDMKADPVPAKPEPAPPAHTEPAHTQKAEPAKASTKTQAKVTKSEPIKPAAKPVSKAEPHEDAKKHHHTKPSAPTAPTPPGDVGDSRI